jgi:hypothetical protein
MKYPVNITELNIWLEQNFQAVHGPRKSFLEVPFTFSFCGEETTFMRRVPFVTIAVAGKQSECCREITKLLESVVEREMFVDRNELLFIRTPFEFEKTEDGCYVSGRIAFWKSSCQLKLTSSYMCKREGAFVPNIQREES